MTNAEKAGMIDAMEKVAISPELAGQATAMRSAQRVARNIRMTPGAAGPVQRVGPAAKGAGERVVRQQMRRQRQDPAAFLRGVRDATS